MSIVRKLLKRFIPGHEAVSDSRWLRPFRGTLLHPRLWHLNRHSAAGGIAVGLFCGLIPGPFQMLGAAAGSVAFRVNLPLAMVLTFYSNPVTIVPLYLLAFELGKLALWNPGVEFTAPPEFHWHSFGTWASEAIAWALSLGKPLALGLPLLGIALAALGYVVVHAGWRWWLVRQWRRRARGIAARRARAS